MTEMIRKKTENNILSNDILISLRTILCFSLKNWTLWWQFWNTLPSLKISLCFKFFPKTKEKYRYHTFTSSGIMLVPYLEIYEYSKLLWNIQNFEQLMLLEIHFPHSSVLHGAPCLLLPKVQGIPYSHKRFDKVTCNENVCLSPSSYRLPRVFLNSAWLLDLS